MPDKLDRCVEHVKAQGHTEESAFAICNAALNKEGRPADCDENLWKEITAGAIPGVNLVKPDELEKSDMAGSLNLFIPITKIDVERREVWGYATLEEADNVNEILDYASSRPHFLEWSQQAHRRSGGKSRGNLRAMHEAIAAGKLIDLQPDDQRRGIYIGAKVVDDDEWKKTQEGVYTGFSVGGKYLRRWPDFARPGLIRYTAQPGEISLVDAPCVPSATFDVVKADGAEQRLFKAGGTGKHKLPLIEQFIDGGGMSFDFDYQQDGLKFSLSKATNNEMVPPEAIEPQSLPWDVAGQQVEQIQPDFKPKELSVDTVPPGAELVNAGAPAISLESTATSIVAKIIKVKPIKKVRVV